MQMKIEQDPEALLNFSCTFPECPHIYAKGQPGLLSHCSALAFLDDSVNYRTLDLLFHLVFLLYHPYHSPDG